MNTVDFDSPPPGHKISFVLEREETVGERGVRLCKDMALFLSAISFVVLIAYICFDTLTSTTSTSEEKKWAMSVLSAATGGIVGYLIRK